MNEGKYIIGCWKIVDSDRSESIGSICDFNASKILTTILPDQRKLKLNYEVVSPSLIYMGNNVEYKIKKLSKHEIKIVDVLGKWDILQRVTEV